ncbi:MAG: hypothetical protein GX053_07600 [Tissierella sp.]|nr:hypothetical protein [Tissierella sp.]
MLDRLDLYLNPFESQAIAKILIEPLLKLECDAIIKKKVEDTENSRNYYKII